MDVGGIEVVWMDTWVVDVVDVDCGWARRGALMRRYAVVLYAGTSVNPKTEEPASPSETVGGEGRTRKRWENTTTLHVRNMKMGSNCTSRGAVSLQPHVGR